MEQVSTQNPEQLAAKEAEKKSNTKIIVFFAVLVLLAFLSVIFSSLLLYKFAGKNSTKANIEKFFNSMSESTSPTPTSISNSESTSDVVIETNTPDETLEPKPQTNQPTQQDEQCYTYTIEDGEFASSGCYSYNDYINLRSYVDAYNQAVWTKDWNENKMDIVCDNEEFYGDQCEEAKEDKQEAEVEIVKYRDLIYSII